jgi:hypothetical protein
MIRVGMEEGREERKRLRDGEEEASAIEEGTVGVVVIIDEGLLGSVVVAGVSIVLMVLFIFDEIFAVIILVMVFKLYKSDG